MAGKAGRVWRVLRFSELRCKNTKAALARQSALYMEELEGLLGSFNRPSDAHLSMRRNSIENLVRT